MVARRFTLEEWLRLVATRKADVGGAPVGVKRTLPRDPDKLAALTELAVRRMRRRFPELYEVIGERHLLLRPAPGSHGRGARRAG